MCLRIKVRFGGGFEVVCCFHGPTVIWRDLTSDGIASLGRIHWYDVLAAFRVLLIRKYET